MLSVVAMPLSVLKKINKATVAPCHRGRFTEQFGWRATARLSSPHAEEAAQPLKICVGASDSQLQV